MYSTPYSELCWPETSAADDNLDQFLATLDGYFAVPVKNPQPDQQHGTDKQFQIVYQSHLTNIIQTDIQPYAYLMPWINDHFVDDAPRGPTDNTWISFSSRKRFCIYKPVVGPPALQAQSWIKFIPSKLKLKINLFGALYCHFNTFQLVLNQLKSGKRRQVLQIPYSYNDDVSRSTQKMLPQQRLEHVHEITRNGWALEKVYRVVGDDDDKRVILKTVCLGKPKTDDAKRSFLHENISGNDNDDRGNEIDNWIRRQERVWTHPPLSDNKRRRIVQHGMHDMDAGIVYHCGDPRVCWFSW